MPWSNFVLERVRLEQTCFSGPPYYFLSQVTLVTHQSSLLELPSFLSSYQVTRRTLSRAPLRVEWFVEGYDLHARLNLPLTTTLDYLAIQLLQWRRGCRNLRHQFSFLHGSLSLCHFRTRKSYTWVTQMSPCPRRENQHPGGGASFRPHSSGNLTMTVPISAHWHFVIRLPDSNSFYLLIIFDF